MEERKQFRDSANLNSSEDLLCRLGIGILSTSTVAASGDADGIELNLGLSLGGRYGAEKSTSNGRKIERSMSFTSPLAYEPAVPLPPLVRTASLPTAAQSLSIVRRINECGDDSKCSPLSIEESCKIGAETSRILRQGNNCSTLGGRGQGIVNAVGILMRTSSLPVENDELRRKRKELQSLKRMEVKRKRLERRNSASPTNPLEQLATKVQQDGLVADMKELNHDVFVAKQDEGFSNGGVLVQKGSIFDQPSQTEYMIRAIQTSPSGSSNSESYNFSDSRVVPGEPASCVNSPVPPLGIKRASSISSNTDMGTVRTMAERAKSMGDAEKVMMQEMPCVSTQGKGPNGRRVEGFLYNYRKGQVRIVCVCHGSFLTPAEFVRHAGGGDVAHPLRHIVVSPMRSGFM